MSWWILEKCLAVELEEFIEFFRSTPDSNGNYRHRTNRKNHIEITIWELSNLNYAKLLFKNLLFNVKSVDKDLWARARRENEDLTAKFWNFQFHELPIQLRNNHNLKLRYWTFRSIHIHSVLLSIDSPRLDDSMSCLKVEPLKFIEFQIDMPKNVLTSSERVWLQFQCKLCVSRESR